MASSENTNNPLGLKFIQKPFKIIHIDMDYFYAQVEERDNPSLIGKPVAIGGPSKTKGVLCTSNYVAREYGVKSAMPTFQAYQKCPHLILIRPDFAKYKEASDTIHEIFRKYTEIIQPLSLDEAFLDVTDSTLCDGSATKIALEIKKKIYERTGLTASAGVSFNKLISKIASDYNKPNGLTVVTPDQRESFMQELGLRKIPGIGKTSMQRFERLGLKKCSDVKELGIEKTIELFGKKNGLDLYETCLGISNSRVESLSKRKAMSVETTFSTPLTTSDDMKKCINELLTELGYRVKKAKEIHFHQRRVSHIKIKLRSTDFDTHTKEIRISNTQSDDITQKRELNIEFLSLAADSMLNYYTTMRNKDIRLMGIGIKIDEHYERQIELQV